MVFRSQYVCEADSKVDYTWPDGTADTRDRVYFHDYTTCHVFEHSRQMDISPRARERATPPPLDRNLIVFIRMKLYTANKNFFLEYEKIAYRVASFDSVSYIERVQEIDREDILCSMEL